MKIGVSSYCYQKLLNGGQMSLEEAIAFTAETGFDAIEFTDDRVPKDGDPIEWARRIGELCKKHGLEVSLLAVWADFINNENEVERVKRQVDVCAALGAKLMRHDATWGFRAPEYGRRSFQDALKIVAPAIREVTEYAATRGVRTMCENHGFFMQDSYRMEALVQAVNHENFGLLVDVGNFACADEPSEKAVAAVAPYAFHAHVKDFLYKPGTMSAPDNSWFDTRGGNHLRGTILGHGVIPVKQCIDILRRAGFDGTLSLEFEGMEDPREAVRRGFAFIEGACAKR
ncbi:MAG: sugar phosphate isomerase/epimerase [Eubacteriales bacterium]|nr:sugar phosphate isomerase/epimerase [Eubacteriales bacterium]